MKVKQTGVLLRVGEEVTFAPKNGAVPTVSVTKNLRNNSNNSIDSTGMRGVLVLLLHGRVSTAMATEALVWRWDSQSLHPIPIRLITAIITSSFPSPHFIADREAIESQLQQWERAHTLSPTPTINGSNTTATALRSTTPQTAAVQLQQQQKSNHKAKPAAGECYGADV